MHPEIRFMLAQPTIADFTFNNHNLMTNIYITINDNHYNMIDYIIDVIVAIFLIYYIFILSMIYFLIHREKINVKKFPLLYPLSDVTEFIKSYWYLKTSIFSLSKKSFNENFDNFTNRSFNKEEGSVELKIYLKRLISIVKFLVLFIRYFAIMLICLIVLIFILSLLCKANFVPNCISGL